MSEEKPEASEGEVIERARLNSETATIAWRELQRFFAQGHAIAVAPHLDLVDVAYQLSVDNADQVRAWMADNTLGQVSDAQAVEWLEANALMWSVVVRPWVLVQPILQDDVAPEQNRIDT